MDKAVGDVNLLQRNAFEFGGQGDEVPVLPGSWPHLNRRRPKRSGFRTVWCTGAPAR